MKLEFLVSIIQIQYFLRVIEGQIIEITNKSGHYWPPESLNKQFTKRISEEINYINEINFKIYK